jgi:hypothetical protein
MTGTASGVLAFTNADVGTTYGTALGLVNVKHFRWVGAISSGHKCTVKTINGDVVFDSSADGSNFIDVHPFYKFMNGINIYALDSGTLYVYLA